VKNMAATRTEKRIVKISGCCRLSKLRKEIDLKPSDIAIEKNAARLDAALRAIVSHGTDVMQKRTKRIVCTQRPGEVDEAVLGTRRDERRKKQALALVATEAAEAQASCHA
jgi:hypothetical protein